MSTRGHVAIKENGKYRYIYNHSDSYIDHLGIILYKYYNNTERVKALIDGGNTGSIYKNLENTANSYTEHRSRQIDQRGTVFEYRERHWEGNDCVVTWDECKAIETEDISEVLGEEFTYIFDTEENKWYIAYYCDKYQLRDLEEILHSKELLEKLFADRYIEKYLPEFYEKCLNA